MRLFAILLLPDDVPRDITGPELVDPPLTAAHQPWLAWLLFAVPAIVLAVLVVRYLLRFKLRPVNPIVRARRQLDRLHHLGLLAKNKTERHFTLLAGILRRCVEKTFGVAASRLTTSEFVAAAAKVPALEPHVDFLQSFLTSCDVAKFAPPAAISDMNRDLDGRLRDWLASALEARRVSEGELR